MMWAWLCWLGWHRPAGPWEWVMRKQCWVNTCRRCDREIHLQRGQEIE